MKKLYLISLLAVSATTAQAEKEAIDNFMWKQCDEDVLVLFLDPEPFARQLPEKYSLDLHEGKARILIAAQECPSYFFNGEDIGQTHEIHHWVAIKGKDGVRPIAGAELTLPTMTWFALYTGSSNPESRERWTASGTRTHELQALSLTKPDPEGGGRVFLTEDMRYSWSIQFSKPGPVTIGVNHDVFTVTPGGETVYNRIQCLANVFSWNSQGSLNVTGGTEPARTIGDGIYPATVHTFLPIWCRASLADEPPM